MQAHGCKTIVFSSSATVYGQPEQLPIREDAPLAATNPYGATKLMSEDILRDLERADPAWRVALLRYFNPVGAHESGTIGEDPRGAPNNLMPYVAQVAVGKRPELQVFGADYDTPDGTGVRDYLHVVDLAEGHVAALRHLLGGARSLTVNLGTGRGSSVLELVHAFERASGRRGAVRDRRRAGPATSPRATPTRRWPSRRSAGGDARPRRDVRRQLALAGRQPERLRLLTRAPALEQGLLARQAPRRRAVLGAGEHPELAERHRALLRRFADQARELDAREPGRAELLDVEQLGVQA